MLPSRNVHHPATAVAPTRLERARPCEQKAIGKLCQRVAAGKKVPRGELDDTEVKGLTRRSNVRGRHVFMPRYEVVPETRTGG